MAIVWRYTPPSIDALPVVRAAAETAVEAAAELIFDESQRLVPVDTGALKASGKVSRDGLTAAISYGEEDAAGRGGRDTAVYAPIVHERMDVHHPHGQAKYLEAAMNGKAREVAETLVAGLRKAIEG